MDTVISFTGDKIPRVDHFLAVEKRRASLLNFKMYLQRAESRNNSVSIMLRLCFRWEPQ